MGSQQNDSTAETEDGDGYAEHIGIKDLHNVDAHLAVDPSQPLKIYCFTESWNKKDNDAHLIRHHCLAQSTAGLPL